MDEKRSALRWNVALPVRYVEPSTHIEGSCRTIDVSTVGARLAMGNKYSSGERFNIMLELSGTSGPLSIEADVVWQRKCQEFKEECNYLTGVVFTKIRDCDKRSLYDHVNTYFPQEIRRHWWNGCK